MNMKPTEREIAYNKAMTGELGTILSVGVDAKTVKGVDYGVVTGILYLAPGNVSGHEVCPSRTVGCSASCLFSAGHGHYSAVRIGRLRKTYLFLHRQPEFMAQLHREIRQLAKKAAKLGLEPAVRLNGTSDIDWENIGFTTLDGEYFNNLFEANPDIQFYDYTKRFKRLESTRSIPNYSLTFSRAETKLSHQQSLQALEMGFDVSVVFDELPNVWMGYRVIDGDANDIRFWRQADGPVVVGLKQKGDAKHDQTGFVVRLAETA